MNHFLKQYLGKIMKVPFCIEMDGEKEYVGEGAPEFTVKINKPLSKSELLKSTSLALGEAYMRKDIEVDRDLYEVLNLFLGHMDGFQTDHHALKSLLYTSDSKKNQKKEVASHYDIGNDFYRLWLDDTMSYSCAYFKEESDTLYEAQMHKIEHILEKLRLEEGMTLLDIGCGWGALLKEAAIRYKVKGMGITLSKEQHDKFQEDIEKEGLTDYLSVKLLDYRELPKLGMVFDRVVSVGMMEHIGRGHYELFLETIDQVLKEKGLCLLHYISALKEHPGDAWIKKYIFPGGVIPSLREIIYLLPEYRFYVLDVESLRRDYNRTLLCWRKNFLEVREQVVASMGEEFARMWEVYLSSCAATFYNGIVDLHQILFSKGCNNDIALHRVV